MVYICLKLLAILALIFFMPKIALAEFVRLKDDEVKLCSFKLAEARNIPYKCKVIRDRTLPLEIWQNRLSFEFGKIIQEDFIFLKKTYGGWSRSKSNVIYDPNKSYQLLDFLPPLIQALNGHRFIPEARELNKKEKNFFKLAFQQSNLKKYLYMNCWGLVYEVLRGAKNNQAQPVMFMGQSSILLSEIRDNSHSLGTWLEPNHLPILGSLTKPGDIILILHTSRTGYEYLDHIAIMIDDGIYFEKAGVGENVPIRLIDEETLQKIWPIGVFRYELRRLYYHALLPEPKAIFNLNSLPIKELFFPKIEIPFNISSKSSIMWDIEDKSLGSIALFESQTLPPLLIGNNSKAQLRKELYRPILKNQ